MTEKFQTHATTVVPRFKQRAPRVRVTPEKVKWDRARETFAKFCRQHGIKNEAFVTGYGLSACDDDTGAPLRLHSIDILPGDECYVCNVHYMDGSWESYPFGHKY